MARRLYYWPEMNNEIKQLIKNCSQCIALAPSKPALPFIHRESNAPMQHIGMDLFHYGNHEYLVSVDRYSGFIWVDKLTKLDTKAVIKLSTEKFDLFGWPTAISTDGGPQFRADFQQFCREHSITHEQSSPYYPQSNGLAEAAVKNAKNLMEKCDDEKSDFSIALAEWRRMPKSNKPSPAELFFNRHCKGRLPSIIDKSAPKSILTNGHTQNSLIGKQVIMQDQHTKRWNTPATVIAISPTGRSYTLRLQNGKQTRRNIRFLKPIKMDDDSISSNDEHSPVDSADSSPTLRRSERLKDKQVKFYKE